MIFFYFNRQILISKYQVNIIIFKHEIIQFTINHASWLLDVPTAAKYTLPQRWQI